MDTKSRICLASIAVAAALAFGVCWGCAPTVDQAVSLQPPASNTRSLTAASVSGSVQSLPQYEQARKACVAGNYRQAADILAAMQKSLSLSEEQREFCHTQEQICLGHLAPAAPLASRRASSPVRQGTDCGPRALLLACEKLGVRTSLSDLARTAGTGPKGTSLQGLKRAAESVGLKAEGVQAGREALPDLPMPAIAWSHGDHYVAVLALQGRGESGTARIHDPNEAGEKTIGLEQLLHLSSGYLLTLKR